MFLSETEIQYAKWFYPENRNFVYVFVISLLIHVLLISGLYFLKPKDYKTFLEERSNRTEQPTISIHFENKLSTKVPKTHERILTDANPSSKHHFIIPAPEKLSKNSTKNIPESTLDHGLAPFLPNASQYFVEKLRNQVMPSTQIQADSGDIPVQNSPVPIDGSLIKERYATKDLSLFQFSQEFHDKFGAIWNSQERWVPPNLQLLPGDVVYYKFYVNSDGGLEKIENLSKLQMHGKDFSGLDKIIGDVAMQVFPISMPPNFSRSILTDVIAIQIVGVSIPMQFSF